MEHTMNSSYATPHPRPPDPTPSAPSVADIEAGVYDDRLEGLIRAVTLPARSEIQASLDNVVRRSSRRSSARSITPLVS
jgi:hypothetical protein